VVEEEARSGPGIKPELTYDRYVLSFHGAADARPRLVLDRHCAVLWHGPNVARLLGDLIPLRLAKGRLVAESAAGDDALAQFVERVGTECDRLLLRSADRRHWAMIQAWSPPDREDLVCAVVNLSIPCRTVQESGLAKTLGLTATESRVLDEFARLRAPKEIADTLSISLSTVRSHLKQVHSKAGVSSAVHLARLVSGYCTR
jgi:DNA-binding CsgD family transcriptional regulator